MQSKVENKYFKSHINKLNNQGKNGNKMTFNRPFLLLFKKLRIWLFVLHYENIYI
jgi:hypothetical protein